MNFSASEIILVAILALLLFGPRRLPEIARQVGKAIAEVRRVSRDFEREVRDAVEPYEREVRDAVEPLEREVRDAEAIARQTYELNDDHSTYLNRPKPDEPKQE